MIKNKIFLTAWCLWAVSGTSLSWADVPVIDMNQEETPLVSNATGDEGWEQADRSERGRRVASSAGQINEVEHLREQMQSLQGQLEQQTHELEQLKSQQKTFYMDLDRRISALQHPEQGEHSASSPKVAEPKPHHPRNKPSKKHARREPNETHPSE